jgi:hypothetical protein
MILALSMFGLGVLFGLFVGSLCRVKKQLEECENCQWFNDRHVPRVLIENKEHPEQSLVYWPPSESHMLNEIFMDPFAP